MASKLRYQPRKVDGNHAALVNAARAIGAMVFDTHTIGRGAPDLMIYYRGKWTPIEVKRPGGKLEADEVEWWERFGIDPIVAIDDVSLFRAIGAEVLPFAEQVRDETTKHRRRTSGRLAKVDRGGE